MIYIYKILEVFEKNDKKKKKLFLIINNSYFFYIVILKLIYKIIKKVNKYITHSGKLHEKSNIWY